jgi:hypothetical protein
MRNNLLIIFSITLFSNLSFVYAEKQINNPIKLLYENRTKLNEVISIGNADLYKIYRFRDSSFNCWEKNESDIIGEFIGGYVFKIKRIDIKGNHKYYFQDSIAISILASILDFSDYRPKPFSRDSSQAAYQEYHHRLTFDPESVKKPDWCHDAMDQLTNHTYLSAIAKHSDEIKEHLKNSKEPEMDKIKLLALCNLSAQEKDSLLNEENMKLMQDKENKKKGNAKKIRPSDSIMPLWVRVKLGDAAARKTMFTILGNVDNDYQKKMEAATAAAIVWDDSCKAAFFNLFNYNIYKIKRDDEYKYSYCYSIHDALLLLIARHHPDEPIFGNRLEKMRNPMDYCDPPFQAEYFKEFAAWVKQTYKYDITYSGFTPYFKIDCSQDQSAIRDKCQGNKQ